MASRRFYALWKNRNGQRLWDGPFPTNTAAQHCLDQVLWPLDGSVITTTIPMTPGEAREAAMLDPQRDQERS